METVTYILRVEVDNEMVSVSSGWRLSHTF